MDRDRITYRNSTARGRPICSSAASAKTFCISKTMIAATWCVSAAAASITSTVTPTPTPATFCSSTALTVSAPAARTSRCCSPNGPLPLPLTLVNPSPVMRIARVTLTAAVLVAVAAVLGVSHSTPAAHANGDPAFTLRNFDYDRTAYLVPTPSGGKDVVHMNLWRVTVCTPRPARLRIRAVVPDDYPDHHRFVRRQPAGCTRHRLRGESDDDWYPDDAIESRLRVAWQHHRQRTSWVEAPDPMAE